MKGTKEITISRGREAPLATSLLCMTDRIVSSSQGAESFLVLEGLDKSIASRKEIVISIFPSRVADRLQTSREMRESWDSKSKRK